MGEQKLTPWFVNGERPARPGVYNVSCRKHDQSGEWFARWDGRSWHYAKRDPSRAAKEPCVTLGWDIWHRLGSWRGLAEKPA